MDLIEEREREEVDLRVQGEEDVMLVMRETETLGTETGTEIERGIEEREMLGE